MKVNLKELVIETGILLLVATVIVFASTSTATDELHLADIRQAKIFAEDYCRKLDCPLPVKIVVVKEIREGQATTTIRDRRCVLTFTKASAWNEEIVAHEACHCALDHQVIGRDGYFGSIGQLEVDRREALVQACALRLIK